MFLLLACATPAEFESSAAGSIDEDEVSVTDSDLATDSSVVIDTSPPEDTGVALQGLRARIEVFQVELPEPAAKGFATYGTWEVRSLNPRLYHEPMDGDRMRFGYTDAGGNGHVVVVNGATVESLARPRWVTPGWSSTVGASLSTTPTRTSTAAITWMATGSSTSRTLRRTATTGASAAATA
jgi:hypothetical protein